MIDMLSNKIENYKKEYNKRLEYFKVFIDNESDTYNFEKNAMNDLIVMLELKVNIKTNTELLQRLKLYSK